MPEPSTVGIETEPPDPCTIGIGAILCISCGEIAAPACWRIMSWGIILTLPAAISGCIAALTPCINSSSCGVIALPALVLAMRKTRAISCGL
jgi:hypothetical protein